MAATELAMQERVQHTRHMTIEEFLDFADARPDGEKWELIEGIPVLSPSPAYFHQVIASNICRLLGNARKQERATWQPLVGMSTRIPASPRSLPQPDVMVMQASAENVMIAENAIVLFEIMSKSNTRSDQSWRKRAYASIDSCQHYVVVDQYRACVVRYDRASGWGKAQFGSLTEVLDLPALNALLPLSDIYDGVNFAVLKSRLRTR